MNVKIETNSHQVDIALKMTTVRRIRTMIVKTIRKALNDERKDAVSSFRRAVKSDPRRMQQAIRAVVYRNTIGGSLTLMNGKGSGKTSNYQPKRGGKSGRPRKTSPSRETLRHRSYYGRDRAYIARMLQLGKVRRGRAKTQGFFDIAEQGIKRAADKIGTAFINEASNIYNGK